MLADGTTGKKIQDYWGPAKKYILGDLKLLENLKLFDKDNIPLENITKIRQKFVGNPDFDPEKIRNASTACEGETWIPKWNFTP